MIGGWLDQVIVCPARLASNTISSAPALALAWAMAQPREPTVLGFPEALVTV
ncbi:hypothetical protein [Rhodoligotrophos defluvii]|uniref:hypothetical protein n=1 Tax=Rhodoligotrophos defluvii TaxID=2561934 RepID=UPI001485082D|nr:hypothetical protein [Rhodoligotrophos defluvii]